MMQQNSNQFLLTTKLAIPYSRSDLVTRARLFDRLQTGLGRAFILLTAPVGFGKTMLLSTWIHQWEGPVSWVSLDRSDNDAVQFWVYIITALDKLQPGIGKLPLSLLQSAQPASVEAVTIALVNALSSLQQHSVLVLDDYHNIEAPAIHQAMIFLLDHLPPHLCLILASRVDPPFPLARWRARNQLSELRADDLRFTVDEAATFLNESMGLQLTVHDVAALEKRTEGWVAGLQLVALSMQGRKDVASFVTSFAGSHRYIVDYLTEEVLRQQPEHVCTFLLQTSILDRICGSLCDAITGRSDGQEMVEQLERANLFLIPLDDERHWYRYHHLFADTLQYRLRQAYAELLPTLHTKASEWLECNTLIPEAVHHALLARDFARAATLIETIMYPLFSHGAFDTLRYWLTSLPDDVLYARPSLCLLYAWAFLYIGDIESYKRPLDAAERAWQAAGNVHKLAEVYTFRASIALLQGQATMVMNYVQQALPFLAEDDLINRGNCMLYAGASSLMLGDMTTAYRSLSEARNLCQASQSTYAMLYAMNFLAEVETVQGKLLQAAETSREVIRLAGDLPNMHASGAHARLCGLYYEWNNLDQALHHGRQAIMLGEQINQEAYMAPIYIIYAQTLWARGEIDEALAMLNKADHAAQQLGNLSSAAHARALHAQLDLAQGNIVAVVRWSEEADIDGHNDLVYEREVEYLVLARLYIAQNRPVDAFALLDRLLQADEAFGRANNAIHLQVLKVVACGQMQNYEQALNILTQTLALAEREGYMRIFVNEGAPMQAILSDVLTASTRQSSQETSGTLSDYVRRLLMVFPQSKTKSGVETVSTGAVEKSVAAIPLIEPLSIREQEVLTLLAAGLSNQAIARQLFVTEGTIKTHTKSIYGKLAVHSRTQAIALARALNLL